MKNILNKFKIDNTTYLLMLFALLSGYIKNVFIIFIIILIHELGHVFFFFLFDIEIDSIVIYPFGGVSKVNKRIHERIYKDIMISLGGILFQLLLILVFLYLYKCGVIVKSTYDIFSAYNKSIILFNLIPMFPLDGSKLLFEICLKFLSFKKSYIVMIIVGSLFLFCFICYNFVFRINDLVINVFLIMELINVLKNFKYVQNKFYLERVLYDNYYDGIISDKTNIDEMRIDKYYYFKNEYAFVNERDFLLKNKF